MSFSLSNNVLVVFPILSTWSSIPVMESTLEVRSVFIAITHRIMGDGDIGVDREEGIPLSSYLYFPGKMASNGVL